MLPQAPPMGVAYESDPTAKQGEAVLRPRTGSAHAEFVFRTGVFEDFAYKEANLPPNLVHALRKFDREKNGVLTHEELRSAVDFFEKGLFGEANGWKIPFEAFPEHVRARLKEFDKDGDEHLDAEEVERGMEALHRERQARKWLTYALIGLLIFTVVLLVCMGLITFFVVEMSKEMRSSNSGVLVDAHSGNVIQTASSDFFVEDGKLVPRSSAANESSCEGKGGSCTAPAPLEVRVARYLSFLSSLLPDDELRNIDNLFFASEDNATSVYLHVNGFTRYPDITSMEGAPVQIFTPEGSLTVDGSTVMFDEKLGPIFERAKLSPGRSSDGSRRALNKGSLAAECGAMREVAEGLRRAVLRSEGAVTIADESVALGAGYREIISVFDADKDGILSTADVETDALAASISALQGMATDRFGLRHATNPPSVAVARMDANQDGEIQAEEAAAAVSCLHLDLRRSRGDDVNHINTWAEPHNANGVTPNTIIDSNDEPPANNQQRMAIRGY